ncbi:MAG: hypothetical protein JWQ89_852 [Devosia sp.]|uniref:hypothetical protein n=1 Tax=Devosia sp. TaxID=1871048 RepID=UPI00262C349B|nr:hypothetical protein [Devosia sp.]MDB5539125.1 hypothetical protein [Devosia sp.]
MNLKTAALATQFVNNVNVSVWANWQTISADLRATRIWDQMSPILVSCSVPLPQFETGAMFGNGAAFFSSSDWKVVIGSGMVPDAPSRDEMTELLRTVYHETRHCEQFFAVLRYLAANARSSTFLQKQKEVDLSSFDGFFASANGNDNTHPRMRAIAADYLNKRTGMPVDTCAEAVARPMRVGDELFSVAKEACESIFDAGNKRMLAQLTNHTTIHIKYNSSAVAQGRDYGSAYAAYFSTAMPYELDAFESETLVGDEIASRPTLFAAP